MNTPFCINCGQALADGASFCGNCGKAVGDNDASVQRKTVYEGNIYKCPSCGENLSALAVNCPVCGHEVRDRSNSNAVAEFSRQLQEIEKQAASTKKKQKTNSNGLTPTEEHKVSLISSFPIPNTKGDLLEFLVLALSNINEQRYSFDGIPPGTAAISDAWEKKFNQAYQKSKIFFGETTEFQKIELLYTEKVADIAKVKKRKKHIAVLVTCGFVLFWIVIFVAIMANQV